MVKLFSLKKRIGVLALICVIANPVAVLADDYNLDNNGNTKKVPYGKNTSIPSSYEGLDYYDCYLPYAKKVKEIGGLCTSGLTDIQNGNTHSAMPEANQNYFVGDYVNYQSDYSQLSSCSGGTIPSGKYPTQYETDTGAAMYVDDNGNKYYSFAIQRFFYEYESAYYSWSTENRGQLVDVILTDGTVIHFVVGDANGHMDTNGYEGDTSAGTDRVCNTLNFPQYRYLFSSIAGNCIELWGRSGSNNSFADKYNLQTSGDGVHIAYYRMYNGKIMDNPERTRDAGKEGAYSLDGEMILTDTSPDEGMVQQHEEGEEFNAEGSAKEKLVSEEELTGMEGLSDYMKDDASPISLPGVDSLSGEERRTLSSIYDNLNVSTTEKVVHYVRVGIVFVGMMMFLYIVILLVSFVFDSVNSLVDFSMLRVVTLGRLSFEDNERKGRHYVQRHVVLTVVALFLIGGILVSGGVYLWVQWIYNGISALLG